MKLSDPVVDNTRGNRSARTWFLGVSYAKRNGGQSTMTPLIQQHSPSGLKRCLFRLPVSLYRARLGWLLGERFLLLTHIGRKSGRPRETVLEVVHHDTGTDTYFIASGWGERSDWVRNVQKAPMVSVNVGKRHFVATAKRLSIVDAQSTLLASARHHPWAFPTLAKLIVGRRLKPTEEDCLIFAQAVPVFGLIRFGGTACRR
jgi:deazaflavin-dependent oxidoreductase (nitroreductase family)